MHRIEINNFGPIEKVEMDVTNVTFLLGEQAIGKSTIAKLIYFFRTWQEEFISITSNDFETWPDCRAAYTSLLRNKFINMFGTTDLGRFDITYKYADNIRVRITSSDVRRVNISLGNLIPKLRRIWEEKVRDLKSEGNAFPGNGFRSKIQLLFSDDYYPVYVPAGRAFLSRQMLLQLIINHEASILNERIREYNPFDVMDAPTRRYMAETGNARRWISVPKIDVELPGYLVSTSESILKGSYVHRRGYDYIRLIDKKLVPLPYSSSGQQEVVWLLNLLLYYAAIGQKCFIIIEEPEAHLHPDAQYLLVKYISAFMNLTNSQTFITTHSPYILTSCNNLLYAEKCARESNQTETVHDIIEKDCWLNAEDVSAYIMEDSTIKDIMNQKLALVEIDMLDSVASEQDDEYEKLCHLLRGGKK